MFYWEYSALRDHLQLHITAWDPGRAGGKQVWDWLYRHSTYSPERVIFSSMSYMYPDIHPSGVHIKWEIVLIIHTLKPSAHCIEQFH